MPRNLLAIVINTFTEVLRQPVYGVVIGISLLLLMFSPSLAMFTIDDDNQLLKDVALSTLLLAGLFLAVFAAATVVSEEIENKTVLTVLSKTVSRSSFILGKFLGIAGAILLAQYFLAIVVLIVVRHGVLQTARDSHDPVVMVLSSSAATVIFIVTMAGNYFYQWRFSSTFVLISSVLATVVLGVMLFVDPEWHFNPESNHIATELIGPIFLTMLAVLILTAIATALATRFNLVTTLTICMVFFMLGVVLQYWLGPVANGPPGWAAALSWVALAIVPNLNFYIVTDLIYAGNSVPLAYVGMTALYAAFYVAAVLMFAIVLFRTREVG